VSTMREISPAQNATAAEFFRSLPQAAQQLVTQIRRQKADGSRPRPSDKLVDKSLLLSRTVRLQILDKIASLVDENLAGRSEMCLQFADLLQRALAHLGLPARAVLGTSIYFEGTREIFRWRHAWVRVGQEVIDGNVDSLFENPAVPSKVAVAPYWGPINQVPPDRRLREERGALLSPDSDVSNVWWPELVAGLNRDVIGRGVDL
jgi:hypothetical protein